MKKQLALLVSLLLLFVINSNSLAAVHANIRNFSFDNWFTLELLPATPFNLNYRTFDHNSYLALQYFKNDQTYFDFEYNFDNDYARYSVIKGSFLFDNGLFFGADFINCNYSYDKSYLFYNLSPGYCYSWENGYLATSLDFKNINYSNNTSTICYEKLDLDFFYSFDYARLLNKLNLYSTGDWNTSLAYRIQLYDNLIGGIEVKYSKADDFRLDFFTGATWKPLDFLIIDSYLNTSYTKQYPIKINNGSLSVVYQIASFGVGIDYYFTASNDSPSPDKGQFGLKGKYHFSKASEASKLFLKYSFENAYFYEIIVAGYEHTF